MQLTMDNEKLTMNGLETRVAEDRIASCAISAESARNDIKQLTKGEGV